MDLLTAPMPAYTGLIYLGLGAIAALKAKSVTSNGSKTANTQIKLVTEDDCDKTHDALKELIEEKFNHQNSKFAEGDRRMGAIEKSLAAQGQTLTKVAQDVATLVGAQSK